MRNFDSDADPGPNFIFDADSYPDTATHERDTISANKGLQVLYGSMMVNLQAFIVSLNGSRVSHNGSIFGCHPTANEF
jgi:hypothetical protein